MKSAAELNLLPLMEEYYTIQGEGFHAGKAAHFLRLAGCDVGCVWCDVKDSWDADKHPKISIDSLLNMVEKQKAETVVITGGEPLMHNLDLLCEILQGAGKKTFLETSGAHPFSGSWDWVCVSPKKFLTPRPESLSRADELKVVIYHPSDFKWAELHAAQTTEHCLLYLQPEWTKINEVLPLIVDYVKQNSKWKISMQIHKFMNIP